MHALDILGDPVRRRILELLADGELAAGDVGRIVQAEFGISQPGVSQHLRVLRESGFASVRAEGTRRLYALDPEPLAEAAQWFTPFERFWTPRLDALGTELARGRRQRRLAASADPGAPSPPGPPDRPGTPARPGPPTTERPSRPETTEAQSPEQEH
ncbi:ArsR/SmtB family transcription factor [Agromyces sp. SYSU T00266]|uniref:ArsR/SmtB family transcription factor n=1 Tax=Agromyces zhanjiangensis TaxID=3158562 RepID=UPI003396B802